MYNMLFWFFFACRDEINLVLFFLKQLQKLLGQIRQREVILNVWYETFVAAIASMKNGFNKYSYQGWQRR